MEFVRWLMRLGFLAKESPECVKCGTSRCVALSNTADVEDKTHALDGVAWTCGGCNGATSVRANSVFARGNVDSVSDSLSWIMRLVLCWSDNTSLTDCLQATGAELEKISLWYDLCTEYYGSQE